MKKNKVIKLSLYSLGTIVLGAFGSGLWQTILNPSLIFFRNIFLNFASLGLQSLKNYTYLQIAKGFHELPSAELLNFFCIFFSMVLIAYYLYSDYQDKTFTDKCKFALDTIKNKVSILSTTPKDTKDNIRTKEEILKELDIERQSLENTMNILKKSMSWLTKTKLLCIILLLIMMFFTSFKSIYINSAIAHYCQLKKICAPSLKIEEIILLDSSFSQIKSADDYIAIIKKLEEIAKKNKIIIPDFSIW